MSETEAPNASNALRVSSALEVWRITNVSNFRSFSSGFGACARFHKDSETAGTFQKSGKLVKGERLE